MTQSNQAERRRRVTGLFQSKLLKAAFSVLLLALLISRLNLSEIAGALGRVVPALLLSGVLVFVAASLLSVVKWQLILKAQGMRVGYLYLVSLFYIGFFFNNFLPTNFGGDVIKVFKLSRVTSRPVEAASSTFLDRASSTFALLLIAIAPAIIELRLLGIGTTAAILILFFISLVAIFLVANASIARRLGRLPLLNLDPFGMRRHVRNFYFSLHEFRQRKGPLAAVLAISLVYQATQIFAIYLLALSLEIHLSILYFFILIPVIQTVSMIPLSLNGLGVREGAWVLLFGQVGVPLPEAFSMSILSLLVMTATSLFGGVLYLFDRSPSLPQDPSRPRSEPDHGQS